jgi:hypothetical protein
MTLLVVLALVVAWLILVAVTTVICAAIARGGANEERARVRVPELF